MTDRMCSPPRLIKLEVHAGDAVLAEGVRRLVGADERLTLAGPADVHVVVAPLLTDQVRGVLATCVGTPVVLVVDDLSDHEYAEAVALGVVAVLPTTVATAGRLGDVIVEAACRPWHPVRYRPAAAGLDDRETRLLSLLAEGLSTRAAAASLQLSERMVKRILERVVHRHALRNRSHAVAYALRSGRIR